MMTWIRIAVRNLLKQKRRSAFTLGAIALGFASVNIFGGFTRYMYWGLKEAYIYAQGNGHITVFKEGFRTEGRLDPGQYLLSAADIEAVRNICSEDPRVRVVTPQLFITGLVSNGEVSTIFLGVGKVPSEAEAIIRSSRVFDFVTMEEAWALLADGKPLADDEAHGVGMSRGLAEKLDLEVGSDLILVSPTVEGQMNAESAEIFFLFNAPEELMNDKFLTVNLELARSLYDTESADRLTILLEKDVQATGVKKDLERAFAEKGLDLDVELWRNLFPSFTKVASMFNIIFTILFTIVFVIVVLSVVNTINMAILERTREVGTLRALGLKRRGVIVMFAVESATLGLLGSLAGLVITVAAWIGIEVFQPRWMPPMMSREVVLHIYLVPKYFLLATVFLLLLSVMSAAVAARRAARMSIIDALGHV
jgi:putative ABC transport system permease protein